MRRGERRREVKGESRRELDLLCTAEININIIPGPCVNYTTNLATKDLGGPFPCAGILLGGVAVVSVVPVLKTLNRRLEQRFTMKELSGGNSAFDVDGTTQEASDKLDGCASGDLDIVSVVSEFIADEFKAIEEKEWFEKDQEDLILQEVRNYVRSG
ncbi:hypothetical protein NDU88_003879 [Pleurodeles waltl]|uniref:Uncharacterized protein n=1 Tax=Pleurodeles waltl TaxID=8319 RepID=A0AAV7QA85_PLEWA|nr:hypothetical protein NDU88_003879 [Pleurodeles waltl]